MSDLEALEQSFRNLLYCLEETDQQFATENDTVSCTSQEASEDDTLNVTYADKMTTLSNLEMLQTDLLQLLSNQLWLVEEQKISLHQLTTKYIATAIEHEEVLHALQEQLNQADKLEKKQNAFEVCVQKYTKM